MTEPEVVTVEANGIVARYYETDVERVLEFERGSTEQAYDAGVRTAAIAQDREGYAMLKVRLTGDGNELERYYGFDVALDHVAELLEVSPNVLPVPDSAGDMGM